jgi:hypothetical protein
MLPRQYLSTGFKSQETEATACMEVQVEHFKYLGCIFNEEILRTSQSKKKYSLLKYDIVGSMYHQS